MEGVRGVGVGGGMTNLQSVPVSRSNYALLESRETWYVAEGEQLANESYVHFFSPFLLNIWRRVGFGSLWTR